MPRPKYGISLSNRSVVTGDKTVGDLVDMAVAAEESGCFDGVWVGDNLLSKPRFDYLVLLSAIAARTNRVKTGHDLHGDFPVAQSDPAGNPVGEPGRAVGWENGPGRLNWEVRPGTGRSLPRSWR